jgi:beta-galactosidase
LDQRAFPQDVAAIWELTERSPWLIGDFVWTAMDYLGEVGIGGSVVVMPDVSKGAGSYMGSWPWVNAFCGDIDLVGQQKAPSFARDVVWGISPLELLVQRPVPEGKVNLPRVWGWHDEQRSWTWPGEEGKRLTVCVYTSGDRVELRLNDRTVGVKSVNAADLKRVEFNATYEPGVLEAVAFRDGAEIARQQLTTAGQPAGIRLIPERAGKGGGRADLTYVAIEIVDAGGRLVPNATRNIELSLSGPAQLIAFGSANPLAVGSFQSTNTQTWDGRALAILRGLGRSGTVVIGMSAAGLRSATTKLRLV